MVGFLFDKIPVMRNVLLSSARLNYFIYLAALRLLKARVDCWTAVLVSVVVCITIPMIVNNLGLVSSQICMRFCKTSSATTETSNKSHLASRFVVVGRNFYKLDGWLMEYVMWWILNTICQISQFNVVSPLISGPGMRLRFIYLGRPHAWLADGRDFSHCLSLCLKGSLAGLVWPRVAGTLLLLLLLLLRLLHLQTGRP